GCGPYPSRQVADRAGQTCEWVGEAASPGVREDRSRDILLNSFGTAVRARSAARTGHQGSPAAQLALGGRMRLGREQQLVHVGGFPAVIRAPAELGAIGRLAFAEQQVIRLAFNPLTRLEPERFRARAPVPLQN